MMKSKMKKGYAVGGMPMVMQDGKKIPAFAADGEGKMKKGGAIKKAAPKKAAPKKMMGGGMMSKGYAAGGKAMMSKGYAAGGKTKTKAKCK